MPMVMSNFADIFPFLYCSCPVLLLKLYPHKLYPGATGPFCTVRQHQPVVSSRAELGKRERLHAEAKATFDRMGTRDRRVSLGHAKAGGLAELQVMRGKGRRRKPACG